MRRSALLAFLLACSHPSPAPRPVTAAKPAPPAAPRGVDQGSFKVLLAGREIGGETFTVSDRAGGHSIQSRTVLHFGDKLVQADGVLDTDAGWRPESASFKRQAGEVASEVTVRGAADGTLTQRITTKGEDHDTPATEKSDLFLGDVSFSHLEPLCQLAGTADQTLSLFPGQALKIGARTPLDPSLAGKRQLTFVPILIADRNAVELLCEGAKEIVARYTDLGLVVVRAGYEDVVTAIAKAESHKPELPAGVVELPRKVSSPTDGGATLACSLLLPADRSSTLPAVAFVTGSGPEDRDDDTPGAGGIKMALFKHLAIALAQSGIASLRCDDRGIAESTGSLAKATLGTLVADAAATVAALRAEPGIDPDRVGIVGHSEGAEVAGIVAEKDRAVKALALVASPGRPLDQMILAQRDEENRQGGFKDDYVAREHRRMAEIYAALRAGKPVPATASPEERKVLEENYAWLATHFRHDPAKTLQKLRIPVFVAQGGKDFQVSVKEDTERLRAAIARAGNKRAQVKVYPELSHIFAPAKTGTVSDYSDPDLHVDLEFIGDLVTFLKGAL